MQRERLKEAYRSLVRQGHFLLARGVLEMLRAGSMILMPSVSQHHIQLAMIFNALDLDRRDGPLQVWARYKLIPVTK